MLASILLLAHAAVPHHHHGYQVCFDGTHCIHEYYADEHGTDRDDHDHDGEDGAGDCMFKAPVVLPSNAWKAALVSDNHTSGPSGLDDLHFMLPNDGFACLHPVLTDFICRHAANGSIALHASSSLRLRAPPAA